MSLLFNFFFFKCQLLVTPKFIIPWLILNSLPITIIHFFFWLLKFQLLGIYIVCFLFKASTATTISRPMQISSFHIIIFGIHFIINAPYIIMNFSFINHTFIIIIILSPDKNLFSTPYIYSFLEICPFLLRGLPILLGIC